MTPLRIIHNGGPTTTAARVFLSQLPSPRLHNVLVRDGSNRGSKAAFAQRPSVALLREHFYRQLKTLPMASPAFAIQVREAIEFEVMARPLHVVASPPPAEVRALMDAFVDFVLRFRERERENEAQDGRFVSAPPVSTESTGAKDERALPDRYASWAAPVQAALGGDAALLLK